MPQFGGWDMYEVQILGVNVKKGRLSNELSIHGREPSWKIHVDNLSVMHFVQLSFIVQDIEESVGTLRSWQKL